MPSLKELERWVGTTQAAGMIGYSRQWTINLAEDKKVRAVKTGAGWIYDPDDLEMFKARMKASKRGKELEHIGRVVRRTYPELMAAVREEEARLGRPMLPSEAEEHARGFFAPQYREDLRAISDRAWEELHEELQREEEE